MKKYRPKNNLHNILLWIKQFIHFYRWLLRDTILTYTKLFVHREKKKKIKRKREHRNPRGCRWRRRISVSRRVGLDSSQRKSNLIFPLIDSGTWFTAWISLGWKTRRIFLSEFHPWRATSLAGTRRGRECEKAKAELSPRAEEVVGGLATELFKSRPGFPRPPLLDSLATVETKEISFRRPARGECSKGGEARDSSRSAFNWWLFLRGGN